MLLIVIGIDKGFYSVIRFRQVPYLEKPGRGRPRAGRMDEVLFRNGAVFDGTRFLPAGTCVRTRAGRIVEVGPNGSPGAAEPVDLGGGTLLPGFIDAHAHPVFAGYQLRRCDLNAAEHAADYLEIVAAYARDHPDEEWITGGGWAMAAFPGGIPTRETLDAVTGDRPAFLPNRDGHGSWVNSAALRLAGIDASTPDPADGRIERDERGDPVGMLQEGAAALVSRLVPVPTAEDWYQALLTAQDYLLSLGITGWQDAIIGRRHGDADPMAAYLRAAQAGTLHATVVGALWWDRDSGLEQLPELLDQRQAGSAGQAGPGGRFRATSVKMMLDGVAENHTAALLDPSYDGHGCQTENSGMDFIDPGELPRYVTALDAAGFQVHFHALGDRAVRNALNAVAAARAANGNSGIRHHLAHLQIVHPDDIARFASLGATANIQALWATNEEQMTELTVPFLGERRAAWQYPFGELAASGAHLAAGSDWPVSSPNPLLAIHVAVNRSMPESAGDPLLPHQALTRAAALAAYTSGSARVNGVAESAGAIRAGYDADFAVTNADLSTIPDAELCDANVVQTWVRGQLAFGRN